jgi:SP family general alpha glucoside:H+ symporter-like MFS transporter
MTLKTAFSVYPKAIGWSIVLSSCLIMEGYDTSVMGSCEWFTLAAFRDWFLGELTTVTDAAYPAFMNHFGVLAKDGTYQIPPDWQNGISGARNAGEIIGLQV